MESVESIFFDNKNKGDAAHILDNTLYV